MAAGADGTITIDTELDSTGFKRGTQRMQQATDNLTQTVNGFGQRMRQGLGNLVSTLQAVGQQAGAAMQAVSDAGGFERSLTGVQRQVMSLQGQFQRLGDAAALGFKTDAQMQRFSLQVGHAQERLQQVREQMAQLGAQRINTAEYDRLTAEMEKVEAVLDRLTRRKDMEQALGVDEESRAYQRLLIQITQAEAEYGRLRDARDALTANGQSYTTGADNPTYQQTAAMLEQMASNLQRFQELASGFGAAAQPAGESTQALEGLDREMQQKPKDASLASKAFSGLGKAISAIGRGAGRAISGLKSLGKHSGQSALTSNGLVKALTGVKRMLLTRIKRTFISALFNSLKAGMNSFARYSSAFNAAMSSMKNSTTGLSGNIAVFAGNLINALAPAISAIIDWVSKAVAALNGLFALLSGKGTFTVAKKGTDDYAKSLKGAGGAAKDLKNQVYGFDELNKEQDNSSGGGGSSGGNVDFEEKDISTLPESIREFAKSIKEAFLAGEFEKVGQLITGSLNAVIKSVDDWITQKLHPAAVKWSANIARILNGMVSGFDWAGLGKTIGDGINTISATINTFLRTFNFTAFGSQFATGINSIFSTVNWSELADGVNKSLKGVLDTIRGFFSTVNWQGIATDVATFIRGIDWSEIGSSLGGMLSAVVTGLNQLGAYLLEEIDWEALGTAIWDGIMSLISSIDWSAVASSMFELLGASITAPISFTIGLAKGIWQTLKSGWDLTKTYFQGYIDEYGGDVVAGLWAGIKNALVNVVDWVHKNVIQPLVRGLEKGLGLEEGTIAATATQLWNDFTAWIEKAWNDISGAVSEFFSNVWTTITGFFGTLGDTAKGIWDGFISGISSTWDGIKNKVNEILTGAWDGIKGAFGTLSEIASRIWDGFASAVSSAWSKFSGPIIDVFSEAWDSIKGAFSGIAEFATNLWEGLKNGLSSAWTNLKDTILKPFEDFWNEVKKFFGIASPSTKAASVGDFILQGLSQGLLDGVQAVLDVVSDVFGRIWDTIKRIFGFGGESKEQQDAKTAGKDIMEGLKDGITGDENTVKDAIKNAGKNALAAFRSEVGIPGESGASTKTKTYGENLVAGLKDGIEAKGVQGTFTNAANKVWSAVQQALNSAFGTSGENSSASKTKYVGQGVALGVNDGINDKGKKGTFTAAADATIKAVKDAINTAFGISSEGSAATKAKYAGNSAVLGLRDGITEKAVASTFTSAANTVQSAVSSALATALGVSGGGFLQGAASASKFKDVGKAICQGAADGINANTSIIKNAAENAAAAALAAAKRKLGINSPSKAFAEIGEYSMLGLESGLKDGQSDVARTMANIADSMVNGFSEVPSIDLSADTMIDGLDNVADKLGGIASIFQAIATAIASMGGLPVPAVAAGRFTPYRARVEDSDAVRGSYGALTDELKRYRSDAGEDASRNYDRLTDILNVLRNMGLTIDGRSLERSMTGLNRDRIQSYGGA